MNAVLTLIPIAIAAAVSPIALIELVLVLFSDRRTLNSTVFVVALIAFTAVGVALGAIGSRASGSSAGHTSTGAAIVLAVFGAALLVVGIRNWRNRADASEPAALQRMARVGPTMVAFLALGATLINPKNLPLLISAGATVGTAPHPWLTAVVFVLVATLPYWVATVYALTGGESAHHQLDRMRQWMIRRNRLIMGILCTVLGLLLLAKGVSGAVG